MGLLSLTLSEWRCLPNYSRTTPIFFLNDNGSFFYTDFYTPENIELAGDLEGIRLERKLLFITFLAILLTNLLGMAIKVEKVKASGTIYIRADGSVDPLTAPISSVDNVTYTFTDNIYDEIVVERNYTVIDGDGYSLEGNNGVPQNQRHSPRNADAWSQKHQEHPKVYSISQFPRRRLYL